MSTENTPVQDEVKNPASLLAKNRDLLSKLHQAQEELATAQNALQIEKTAHSDTTAKLRKFRAEDPFRAVLAEISPSPLLMERVLQDRLSVDIDADGKAILLNKAGEPLTWERKNKDTTTTVMPVELTKDSMFAWLLEGLGDAPDSPVSLLHQARGTGAPGSTGTYTPAKRKAEVEPAKTAPPSFGLR